MTVSVKIALKKLTNSVKQASKSEQVVSKEGGSAFHTSLVNVAVHYQEEQRQKMIAWKTKNRHNHGFKASCMKKVGVVVRLPVVAATKLYMIHSFHTHTHMYISTGS